MQVSVTFPYNVIQPYRSGNSYQDYQLAVPCPVSPGQTPTLQVTPGGPSLILLPSVQSGGTNTLSVTVQPTYQNAQIVFTVRATPAPAYAGSTDGVILNLQVKVTYECSSPMDGVTPTAAVTMFQGAMSNYPCTLTGSDSQNSQFFGHNPMVPGTTAYPAGSVFAATASPPGPPKRIVGAGGDVVVNVTGTGDATCGTAQVQVNVNQSSQLT
jgi:hypothetical protein